MYELTERFHFSEGRRKKNINTQNLIISSAIKDQKGYTIDRRKISINDEVKELGTFKASIDFGNGQSAEVDFEVIAE